MDSCSILSRADGLPVAPPAAMLYYPPRPVGEQSGNGYDTDGSKRQRELIEAISRIPAELRDKPPGFPPELVAAIQQIPEALRELAKAMSSQPQPQPTPSANSASSYPGSLARGHIDSAEEKQVAVHVTLEVRRVFNINTVGQTFGAQVFFVMMWLCPPMEEPPLPEEDDGDWLPKWTPKYRLRRMMEEITTEVRYFFRVVDGVRWVYAEHTQAAHVFEELELRYFPVDCQDLCVEVMSTSPLAAVRWVPMTFDESFVDMDTTQFFGNDLTLLKSMPFTYSLYCITLRHHTTSSLRVNVKVVRNSRFYQFNVLMIMLVLCTLVLCSWQVHPADIASRQDVDFNLILTIVAFKLILVSMLPPVSYITMLDVYVLVGFLFVTGATVCHSALPWTVIDKTEDSPLTLPPLESETERTLIEVDTLSFYAFMGFWTIFNITYAVVFRYQTHNVRLCCLRDAMAEQAQFDKEHAQMSPAGSRISSKSYHKAVSSMIGGG